MDLKTLHLEKEIVFPKNLNEKIFDKNIIAVFDTEEFDTPEENELNEQGFWGTRGANGLHVYFRNDDFRPFTVRVIPNYEDDNDKVLRYQLNFYFKRNTFQPLYKYINEWGRKNRKGEISLTSHFVEWLDDGHISDYNGRLEITTTTFNDEIMFEMKDEAEFVKLLAEISTAFRKLATEHSNTAKDSYDNYGCAAIQNYKEKDFTGVDYKDLVENMLVPVLTAGLDQGLERFRITRDTNKPNHVISIAINKKQKSIEFYNDDKCTGKTFFEFELGAIVSKCISLAKSNGLSYSEEVANWFKEAIQNVQNIFTKLSITIKIPEAENPTLEYFE